MRDRRGAGLEGALRRWNTARGTAETIAATEQAARSPRDSGAHAVVPLQLAPLSGARRPLVDMSRTQARHLALTFVRNQGGYAAHEVWRTEQIYDLVVMDLEAGTSFVVQTAKELAQLMTHLQQPTLLRDAARESIVVNAPFFEEVYDAREGCMSVARYTLVARFRPDDPTDHLDVVIEPPPGPACDLGQMYLLADESLISARDTALAVGERERSRVLAEVSRRLQRYHQQARIA